MASSPRAERGARLRPSPLVRDALAAGRPALDEWGSKHLLAAYGVPVPAGALVDE